MDYSIIQNNAELHKQNNIDTSQILNSYFIFDFILNNTKFKWNANIIIKLLNTYILTDTQFETLILNIENELELVYLGKHLIKNNYVKYFRILVSIKPEIISNTFYDIIIVTNEKS